MQSYGRSRPVDKNFEIITVGSAAIDLPWTQVAREYTELIDQNLIVLRKLYGFNKKREPFDSRLLQ